MDASRYRTWLEIDLGRIKKNYLAAMRCTDARAEAIAVVKSNAYGHGDFAVARALAECGVRRFAVSNIDEAVRLRELIRELGYVACEILILGYTPSCEAKALTAMKLTQAILSEEYAAELADFASRSGLLGKMRTHLAIDTGMRRIGIDSDDTDALSRVLGEYGYALGIKAVFTHLCAADSSDIADTEFTALQIKRFHDAAVLAEQFGIKEAHCLNSAGMLRHFDSAPRRVRKVVRPGIILYGLSPTVGASPPFGFSHALEWKTSIAMIKTVRRGDCIGYGRNFRAEHEMRIATLPVGYADGYPRELSNKGCVVTSGYRAPITGKICMNQMMVDVSGIDDARVGSEVILIGKGATCDAVASIAKTISYEIISRIDRNIPRIYRND